MPSPNTQDLEPTQALPEPAPIASPFEAGEDTAGIPHLALEEDSAGGGVPRDVGNELGTLPLPVVTDEMDPAVTVSMETGDLDEQWSIEPENPDTLRTNAEAPDAWQTEETSVPGARLMPVAPAPASPGPPAAQPEAPVVPSVAPMAFAPESAAPKAKRKFAKRVLGTLLVGAGLAGTLLWLQARGAVLTVSATGAADQSLRAVRVTVDGELKCNRVPCGISGVGAGNHMVRVMTDEYGTVERVVTMSWGQAHSVDFFLPRPSQTAAVSSARRPQLTPTEQPMKPPTEQPPEPPQEETSQLGDLQTVNEAAPGRPAKTRAKKGTIKINSIPISQVTIDGRVVGNTPLTMGVAAGSHNVAFSHSEYGRREVVVQVNPNHEAVASVLFRPRKASSQDGGAKRNP